MENNSVIKRKRKRINRSRGLSQEIKESSEFSNQNRSNDTREVSVRKKTTRESQSNKISYQESMETDDLYYSTSSSLGRCP